MEEILKRKKVIRGICGIVCFALCLIMCLTSEYQVFADTTEDPQYTYFTDGYEVYDVGQVVKRNMPTKYVSFSNDSYEIVETEDGGKALRTDSPSVFEIDCSIIEKEVSLDFKYDGQLESHGGLFVKMLLREQDVNEQYFSINPVYDSNNIIVTDTTNEELSQTMVPMTINSGTWYSVKSRMIGQVIYVKVWEKGTTEPENWSATRAMGAPVTDNTGARLLIEFSDPTPSTAASMYIDNLCIKTWDELQGKPEYTITANVNNSDWGIVSGDGSYLEGNFAILKAEANPGYEFVSWTDESGEIVSTAQSYSFEVSENRTVTANFAESVSTVKSFMADGMTLPAKINIDTKTIDVIFASDVDLSQVRPYFYFEDANGTEAKPYKVMDLSDGTENIGNGWTVKAKQNRVMLNLYVDGTNGSDDNTGCTPKEAFATIAKAQEAVRALETWTGDVLVNIADGEYILTETLEFDSRDSAENGCSVIYRSLSGNVEDVIVSSGIELSGWEESKTVEGAWEIDASEIPYSRDLYVDGELATIARTSKDKSIQPNLWDDINDPEMEFKSNYGYIASGSKAELYKWRNQSDIEFVYEEAWTFCVIPVEKIENNGDGTSKVTMYAEAFQAGQVKPGRQIDDPNYIQNAFELLDEAGEWYFDRTDQKIYYIPEDGKNPNEQNIVIPTLDQLITVNGTQADTVDGLAFKDITFEYTSYLRPHTMGQVEIQANFVMDPGMERKNNHDCYIKTPGGVTVAYATGMRVEGCTFQNLSASALDFEEGMVGSTIVGNSFYNIGASGIQVGGVSVRDAQPYSPVTYVKGVLVEDAGADPGRVTEQILVMSNKLENIGAAYKGSIGIFAGYVRDITIAQNDLNNTPYSAISAGWGWGYWDEGGRTDNADGRSYYKFDTPTIQERYVIENNHITKVCQRLADGGAIYTLSLMPGSIVSGNVMDECKIKFGGLYFDEASGGFKAIENNIATDTVNVPYNYHLVTTDYTDRKNATETVMNNNYFKTGSTADPVYSAIWENAGVLTLAADRTFDVSVASSITGGTVSVTPSKARAGEILTVTATAAEGYTLRKVTGNGIVYADSQMIMPDENVLVSAVFSDRSQLDAVILEASKITEEKLANYTNESAAAFKEALEAAADLAEDASQEEVDFVVENLQSAIDGLTKKENEENQGGNNKPGGTKNPFTDVSKDSIFYDAILWAYENDITKGRTETTFEPLADCTRGEGVTFLWRAEGCPEPTITKNPFTDVSKTSPYYKAILWAYENGITTGKTATTFQPGVTVTREQFVTFLWRNAGKPSSTVKNPFVDVVKDKYSTPAILWAYENGITTGKTATTFQPDASSIRQHVVTFLYRAYN